MKKFVFKILTWFSLRCRLYYVWSRVYRFVWERGYPKLPPFSDYGFIEAIAGSMKWRRDTWIMLWDAVSDPRATYLRHCQGKEAGDCDDIALWAINRLHDIARRNGGILRSPELKGFVAGSTKPSFLGCDLESFGLLSVPWIKEGKIAGHNVGVFRHRVAYDKWEWCHISNWYGGQIKIGFASLPAVVEDVLSGEYGLFSPRAESLGWAVADLNLGLREYHWKHRI